MAGRYRKQSKANQYPNPRGEINANEITVSLIPTAVGMNGCYNQDEISGWAISGLMSTGQDAEMRVGDELKLSKNELQRLLRAEEKVAGKEAGQKELNENQISKVSDNGVAAGKPDPSLSQKP